MVYDLHRIFLRITRDLEITPSISSTQLAKNLGVERHTVTKTIKSATGLTFREFRKSVLLKRSVSLLKDEPNRSIKEVAFALGYRSQGSLSRFVRTVTGRPTKDLRVEEAEEIAS